MAINRFSTPTRNQPISQFVPRDTRLIAKVLAEKQMRYDREEMRTQAAQDELSQMSGIGEIDQGILRDFGTQMNDIAQQYSNKDLGDPRIAKELRGKMRQIQNDPLIRNTQQTLAAVGKYQADKQKMMLDGEYRRENDPMALQLESYQANGGAVNGGLTYGGMAKGVDENEAAEKLFNNLPKTGQYKYAQLGETVKKIGWEGISNSQIENMMGANIEVFSNTQAGKQALRRYELERREGTLPVDKNGEVISRGGYLGKIVHRAGMERVGGIGTSGELTGGYDSAGRSLQRGNSRTNVEFTTPVAASLGGIEFKNGSIVGDGISSWGDALANMLGISNENITFADVWNDERLTETQKTAYAPILLLAEAQGISHEAASKIIDKRIAPQFTTLTGKAQTDATKSVWDKGAGYYSTSTIIDSVGKERPAVEYFEEQGLLTSDGNFDPEAFKELNVRVNGYHITGTGVVPDGDHLSVGTDNVILVNRDPSSTDIENYIASGLTAQKVVKIPDYVRPDYANGIIPGGYMVIGKDGKAVGFDEQGKPINDE